MIFIKLNSGVSHDMIWNLLQGNFSNSLANLILENFPMNQMLQEINQPANFTWTIFL